MSIKYVNGKPFAEDALPVDHPKCCGECYLWCELSRFDEDRRDAVVPVNQRGHLAAHEKFIDPERMKMWAYPLEYDDMSPEAQRSVAYMALSRRGSIYECNYCSVRPAFDLIDGEVRADTECPANEGVLMEYEVSFPSGKIVIDDDMRDVHEIDPVREEKFASYNTAFGQGQVVQEYAKHNIAYGPVGNTCPGVYLVGTNDRYQIANPAYDSEYEAQNFPGVEVASVCTDLWAYSIMDYDEYIKRGGPTDMSWTRSVVDIKPGTYHFVHHTGKRSFDRDAEGPIIYADFWRVGD